MKKIIFSLVLVTLLISPAYAQTSQTNLTPQAKAVLIAELKIKLNDLLNQLILLLTAQLSQQQQANQQLQQLVTNTNQQNQNLAQIASTTAEQNQRLAQIVQNTTPIIPPSQPPFIFEVVVEAGTGIIGAPLHPQAFYAATDCDDPCEWPGGYTDRQFIYFTSHSVFDKAIIYLDGARKDTQSLTDFFRQDEGDGIIAWGALDEGDYTYKIIGSKSGYPDKTLTGSFTIKSLTTPPEEEEDDPISVQLGPFYSDFFYFKLLNLNPDQIKLPRRLYKPSFSVSSSDYTTEELNLIYLTLSPQDSGVRGEQGGEYGFWVMDSGSWKNFNVIVQNLENFKFKHAGMLDISVNDLGIQWVDESNSEGPKVEFNGLDMTIKIDDTGHVLRCASKNPTSPANESCSNWEL